MIGKQFGQLTVIAFAGTRNGYKRYWTCRCDCGAEKDIREFHLTGHKILSCGCRRVNVSTLHGSWGTPEYWAWNNMRQRCSNPKHPEFKNYGARGIHVCPEWANSFGAFFRTVGSRPTSKHTLERIKNSKGYEPGNVEWRTMHDQSRNKRNNALFTVNGETKTLKDWTAQHGIAYTTVCKRLKTGWSIEDALKTPPDKRYARSHDT